VQIQFAGTPAFASTILQRLITTGLSPSLVITQPDRPQGRGQRLAPSPVKVVAEAAGIEVFQPATLSAKKAEGAAALDRLSRDHVDVLVVAAYGLIIPQKLLTHPDFGAVNIHASLLPRWRGAAPVEYAIIAGDKTTGISLMQMDAGLDTGAILCTSHIDIGPMETGIELTHRLAELGAVLLCEKLPVLGTLAPRPQDDSAATYAPKLTPDIAAIRWSESATAVHNRVRALTGRMTAYTSISGDKGTARVRVLSGDLVEGHEDGPPGTITNSPRRDVIPVNTGNGLYGIRSLQLSIGKGLPMSAIEARNGYTGLFNIGKVFYS
jgi:methionyl-tRNA formyltransferase